jgi:hypothetical protein
MDHPIFRPGAQRQLKKVGEADLVIGLPTYKNPYTAAHVARVALEGARTYYPQLRTVLINADAGLKATTRRAVMAQASAADMMVFWVTGPPLLSWSMLPWPWMLKPLSFSIATLKAFNPAGLRP